MMTPSNILSADKPLTDPKDDRLRYAPFAEHLAESICKMISPEGPVVAIYGSWGSGKTTLLNFVYHYLQQKPESEQPIIVRFNPWWFSGHEDLTRRFFDQLQAVLRSKGKSVAEDLIKRIADFAELVSETSIPYVSNGSKVAAGLLGAKQKDVPELKGIIADTLREQQKRILVIIDDIDRLTAEEIRQLFRVIKAVADFPNIIYLLAFDKDVVIKALAETQGIPGEAYLEKIVQVPFELPLPDKTSLYELLSEKLNAILAGSPKELFDQTDWGNVYLDGIEHFIATPRDVVRLTNTLSVTYPEVKSEVNAVDFIAIETLRVFCPPAYDIIRKNPGAFTGYIDIIKGSPGPEVDNFKPFHNSWLDQVQEKDRESVTRLLIRLFPRLQTALGNTVFYVDWGSTWRRQLRVCSPDIFPIYFRLAIPEGSISRTEMKAMLALADNAGAFGAKLVELANQKRPDGTTRVRAFLEQLEGYTEKEIPSGCIPTIVQAFFDVGDELLRSEDELPQMLGLRIRNDFRMGRIIWQLLYRLEEPERFKVLKEVMSNGRAIATIVREVVVLGEQHGKYEARPEPEDERVVNVQHLRELEELALHKIQKAAQQGSLLLAPKLPTILYSWRDWANGEEEVRQWVKKVISGDKGLVELLEKFLKRRFRRYVSDKVGTTFYRLDPQWLEPFLEPSEIIGRVRHLAEANGLTENQRIAMRQLVKEYEIREQGKDPDHPSVWEEE